MKFWVERTSGSSDTTPPCTGAKRATKTWMRPLFEHGKHVGEEPRSEKEWRVSITSLKQLLDLMEEEGQLILKNNILSGEPTIEIYDDYRE